MYNDGMNKTLNPPLRLLPFFSLLLLAVGTLHGCKNSSFEEVIGRCLPECEAFDSPIPVGEVKNAFEGTITNTQTGLAKDVLTGRWIMLVADRFTVDSASEKQVNDVLFTKTLLLTDFGTTLEVSDCHNTETYTLSDGKFTIPKNSIFFNIPGYDNIAAIQVNENQQNLRLSSLWNFKTPQNTTAQLDVNLYKVDDSDLGSESLGKLNGDVDIFCYSYLHLFTVAEKRLANTNIWISGQAEYKEVVLKLDASDGLWDSSLSLAITSSGNGKSSQIFYNQNTGGEYECFGSVDFGHDSDDFLSFSGEMNLVPDSDCLQTDLNQLLSFSGLASF